MKKYLLKTITIIFALILFTNIVNAENVKCPPDPTEPFEVCWDEKREDLGTVTVTACHYEYITVEHKEKYNTREEAELKCKELQGKKPACCDEKDPKKPMCPNAAICKNGIECKIECNEVLTATFKANGGKWTDDDSTVRTKSVKKDQKLYSVATTYLKRDGYEFYGWSEENGGEVAFPVTISSNKTYFAIWKKGKKCPTGQYLSAKNTCSKCPAGYYCEGGIYQTVGQGKTACPTTSGSKKYISPAGSSKKSDCKITCDQNQYVATPDAGCTSCPRYTRSDGGTVAAGSTSSCVAINSKIKCEAGTYLPASKTTCATCPKGKYCTGGSWEISNKDKGITGTCPKGYRDGTGRTSYNNCIKKCSGSNYVATARSETCNGTCKPNQTATTQTFTYGSFGSDCRNKELPPLVMQTSSDDTITDNNFYSVKSKVNAKVVLEKPKNCDGYIVTYETIERDTTKQPVCEEEEKTSTAISYVIRDLKDYVYCLQPGKSGPGKECKWYVESKSFDVANCKNQFENKKGQNKVECGLAQILYQTVKYDSKKEKYKSTGKYSNGAITLALRLWMAEYAGGSQIGLGDMGEVSDDPEIDWVTSDNYYAATVKAIKNMKSYSNKNELIANYDKAAKNIKQAIKCNKKVKDCAIYNAVDLYKKAQTVSEEDYLGGDEFLPETPQITVSPEPTFEDFGEAYKVGLPEEIGRLVVEKDCKDINNPACVMQFEVYDASGKKLEGVDIEGYCKKEYCEIKIKYKMLCDEIQYQQEMAQDILRIYIKGWYESSGYIKFYRAKTNPDKYQKMISFAFNKKWCEDQIEEKDKKSYYEYPVLLECPECDNKCDDLTKTKQLRTNCESNETTTVNVDPDMNCIINACKKSDKLKFDETEKVGANVNICHIYCREDSDFYLAPKTTVYAGMRFSYDIRPALLADDSVGLSSSFTPDQKLTSIVLQKKQCTSEIDYDSWKSTFDKINEAIKDEKDSTVRNHYKKQLNTWITELKKCNLYDDTAIKDDIVNSLTATTTLDFSYQDSTYGASRKMGTVTNSYVFNTTYCSNTADTECYKYEKGKEVTLNGSNKTTTLKYCNGSSCDNKVKVPTNDYAAFTAEMEIGFYQPLKYYAEEYTGVAVLDSAREKDKTYLEIPNYEYPIRIDTPAGSYNVNYKFGSVSGATEYNYTCKYDVTVEDCRIINKDGSVDLSNCKIAFRNVDLNNLFPTEREHETNWTGKEDIIQEIQDSADSIFTDEDHLEYSYTLTPEGIKQIKDYNSSQNHFGGYLNETLSCDDGMSIFIDCESSFLNDISKGSGKFTKIIVNKAGAR